MLGDSALEDVMNVVVEISYLFFDAASKFSKANL